MTAHNAAVKLPVRRQGTYIYGADGELLACATSEAEALSLMAQIVCTVHHAHHS